MIDKVVELTEQHVIDTWEMDLEDGLYFYMLSNGDSIGYNYYTETFSLNNYWNEITRKEANELYNKYYDG